MYSSPLVRSQQTHRSKCRFDVCRLVCLFAANFQPSSAEDVHRIVVDEEGLLWTRIEKLQRSQEGRRGGFGSSEHAGENMLVDCHWSYNTFDGGQQDRPIVVFSDADGRCTRERDA